MGRDHSIECERCLGWYGGLNGPDLCECWRIADHVLVNTLRRCSCAGECPQ